MARIDLTTLTESTVAGASPYTLILPPTGTYAVGDVLFGFITNNGGGTTIAQSGGSDWTVVTGQVNTTNVRSVPVYKKATTTTETNPTFTIAVGTTSGFSFVVKEVDATTQIDASAIAVAAAATSITSSAPASSTDNVLALFCCAQRENANTNQLRIKSDQATALNANVNLFSTDRHHLFAYRQLGAAGAQSNVSFYNTTAQNMQLWTIYFKNVSGGQLMPWAGSGLNELVWYGPTESSAGTITNSAASNFASAAQINGIDTSTTAPTFVKSTSATALDWGYYTSYSQNENFASPATKWVGNYHAFTFPDLTGKVLSFEWYCAQATDAAQIGADGHIVGLTDGTNLVVYKVAPKSTGAWVAGQWERFTVEPGVTTAYYSSGTVANAVSGATGILYASHRNASNSGAIEVRVRNLCLLDKATIVGGGTTNPASWNTAFLALTSCGLNKIALKQAGAQYQFNCSVQVGDGTIKTVFNPSPQSYEISPAYDSKTQPWWKVGADRFGVTVKASSDDSIDPSASGMITSQSATWSLDAASSTSAAYDFQSLLAVGFSPTWSAAVDQTGLTFKGGKTVNLAAAATWTNFIVSATTSANAAMSVTANGCTLSGGTIDLTGSTTAYHLELGASVKAITLANHTFTGAAGTNKVRVLKAAATIAAGAFVTGDHYEIKTVGTTDFTAIGASANTIGVRFTATGAGSGTGDAYAAVKITISGTTSLAEADVDDTGKAVAWVAAPQPTLSATVLANTRCLLWNRTTSAELDNAFVSGTSYSKIITSGASSNDVLDLYTFKEGYEESVATIIYAGSNASFAVSQATDAAIQYYRTEESVTDYTTLTEFNFYSPDIYIQADDGDGESTLKKLFIFYNGALTTADGATYMRGGVTFNSAFDVVINRSVRAIAVDNVSVTYGLHFTDEDVIRVTTDDGTSWIAPPSAPGSIRYAFGVAPGQIETGVSGLTGAESTQLMALPSAAATATAVWSKTLPL